MRPGLVFVGLFAVLLVLYFLLRDSLGALGTFLLQASLVAVIFGGTVWYRYARKRKAWFFFRMEDDNDDQEGDGTGSGTGGSAPSEEPEKLRKAG